MPYNLDIIVYHIILALEKDETMNFFLAGGAGYIGSHTALALSEAGHTIVAADNYSNSSPEALRRVSALTGQEIRCREIDLCDCKALEATLREEQPDCVIHFAGFKAVGESVREPLSYYRNNLTSTMSLLEAMCTCGIKKLVFSSSSTVYGSAFAPPYTEEMPRSACAHPYGRTKHMIEQIVTDVAAADPSFSALLLRYFNPIGAHESGRIGEDPTGIPNNLMPYITQVAIGKREKLTVFGGDYDTPDGTCLRDYLHVMDLAEGHVKAAEHLLRTDAQGVDAFNLGTGIPYSVLDITRTFERVNEVPVPYVIGPRRDGDLPVIYGNCDKAAAVLGWSAKRGLEEMCRDSWRWQKDNPHGYRSTV